MIAIGLQFVGLNVNPGRSIVTLTCLICSGIPSMIVRDRVGPGAFACDRQRRGVRVDFDLRADDHFRPRLNGPASAGLTIDRPNGAPCVGAGDEHFAAVHRVRVAAQPDADRRLPDQAFRTARSRVRPALRGTASTPERLPSRPGGMCSCDRLEVLVAVFAAHRHRERRERAGLHVQAARRQTTERTAAGSGTGLPFGPEVILNCEARLRRRLPDHGAIDASVV